MKFDIHLNIEQSEPSDRVKAILSDFDMTFDHTKEDFQGDIDIDGADWCIGAIIGGSGTGKSTIAKELFGSHYVNGYEYTGKSVIDDMPSSASVSDIEQTFSAVGFSSPPSWLKPYSVLSTGEKMRVDLARAILQESDMVVFDEFTSVVDRTIAKTASYAIQKAIRKNGCGKKFVAVSCHKDIQEWLMPDWVYDTDKRSFFGLGANIASPISNLMSIDWVMAIRSGYGTFLGSITI